MSLPSFIPWVSYLLTLARKNWLQKAGYMQESRKCTKSDYIIGGGLIWARNRCLGRDTRVGCLKWYVPIAFSSPRAQSEVVLFWCQMKAHIFLIIAPNFQLQIHYTLEVIAENVPISGIPILIFLRIFIIASSPVSHRGKLGNGEHLSSLAYKCNIQAWFEKSSIQPQKNKLSTTKLQTFIEKIHSLGTYGLEKKMAAFAITLAIPGNCELY